MNPTEAYAYFGLTPDASSEDLKKAYKKKCFEIHPDRTNGDDTEFKKCQEIYQFLTNPQPQDNFGFGFNINEIFNNFFDNFGIGQKRAEQREILEKDLFVSIIDREVPLSEIIDKKINFTLTYQTQVFCRSCVSKKCDTCKGQGIIQKIRQQGNAKVVSQTICSDCIGGLVYDKHCQCQGKGIIRQNHQVQVEIKAESLKQ